MGKRVCRIGHTAEGFCTSHNNGGRHWTGPLITGTAGFTIQGIPACVVGDIGQASCGHQFRVKTGSPITTAKDGISVARVDDVVEMVHPGNGVGILKTGSDIMTSE